jgi:hypothetical protein
MYPSAPPGVVAGPGGTSDGLPRLELAASADIIPDLPKPDLASARAAHASLGSPPRHAPPGRRTICVG